MNMIWKGREEKHWCYNLIQQVKFLMVHSWNVDIVLVCREGNKVADWTVDCSHELKQDCMSSSTNHLMGLKTCLWMIWLELVTHVLFIMGTTSFMVLIAVIVAIQLWLTKLCINGIITIWIITSLDICIDASSKLWCILCYF